MYQAGGWVLTMDCYTRMLHEGRQALITLACILVIMSGYLLDELEYPDKVQ